MSDLVSIIVPIYNVERYLDKCINTIVSQTYTNLEIILVDDGSPDNCPAICDQWAKKDSRIKVVHKQNQGLGMARNTGIEHATGKYICFFDSDDYIADTLVEKCIAAYKEHNADLVWYSMSDVDENAQVLSKALGSEVKVYSDSDVKEKLLPQLMSHDYREGSPANFAFSAWSGMFSMDIIRKNNLRFPSERVIISEDTYFLLEYYFYTNRVAVLDDILYFHYINTSSLTTTYKADRHSKNTYFFDEAVKLINKYDYSSEIHTRLCMLYHSFTLAALKMIVSSDLSEKDKRRKCTEILKSGEVQRTITPDVLNREKKTVRLFFRLASLKLVWACNLFLKLKK